MVLEGQLPKVRDHTQRELKMRVKISQEHNFVCDTAIVNSNINLCLTKNNEDPE